MIGIDEVGRGAWAGPLVVVAVELDEAISISGLTDSKLLTPKQRIKLDRLIRNQANTILIDWTSSAAIDQIGLAKSMSQAVRRLFSSLSKTNSNIVIDGNINYLKDVDNARAVVKAEHKYPAVAAASVVAKVARDSYMAQIAVAYPEYDFQNHMGYGTKAHTLKLQEHGVSPIHRQSFKPIGQIIESHSKRQKS